MSEMELSLDLDMARGQRAAEREGKKKDLPLIVGGQIIATLPVELPVAVLAPLRNLDGDLTLLLREAVQATKAAKGSAALVNQDITELVIDLLANNPRLPMNALDTFKEVAENLLSKEGLDALIDARPSGQDVAFLVKGVFRFYGFTLGKPCRPPTRLRTPVGGRRVGLPALPPTRRPKRLGRPPRSRVHRSPSFPRVLRTNASRVVPAHDHGGEDVGGMEHHRRPTRLADRGVLRDRVWSADEEADSGAASQGTRTACPHRIVGA